LTSSYKATLPEFQKDGLSDFLVYNFIKYGKEKGYEILTSGSDTNLFGHHLSAGLFTFKRQWNFGIIPEGRYEQIKILNYNKFSDVIIFCSGKNKLKVNVIFKQKPDDGVIKQYIYDITPDVRFFVVKENVLKEIMIRR